MKKRTLVAMLLVMLLVMLSACSANIVEEGSPFFGRFQRYKADVWTYVYTDKVTGVCYLWHASGYGGGLAVMVDANGKPLIYEGE